MVGGKKHRLAQREGRLSKAGRGKLVFSRRPRETSWIAIATNEARWGAKTVLSHYLIRWGIELDIRSIKQTLGLDHVRCKSPEMVRKELWTTLLAYNLIRTTSAAAALLYGKQPRRISFTRTCQYVLSAWTTLSAGRCPGVDTPTFCKTLLRHIASCEVADRPGRIEPRVIKRRRHRYPLMQKPRAELKAELEKTQPTSMIDVAA